MKSFAVSSELGQGHVPDVVPVLPPQSRLAGRLGELGSGDCEVLSATTRIRLRIAIHRDATSSAPRPLEVNANPAENNLLG